MLGGCTLGPNYVPPRPRLPTEWSEHAATAREIARTEAHMRDWWGLFGDPVLDRLVARAIEGNLDLRIAGQRLLAARAVRTQIAAGLAPQVDAGSLTGIQRFSTTLEFPPLPGVSPDNRLWAPGFTASWELDVFGRIRRQIEAQDAEVEADLEQRRGVLLAVIGELAQDYVTLRATQRQLDIATRNISAAAQGLALTQRVFTQGLGTTLQVAQARAQLETQQATVQPLRTRVAQLSHAIGELLGEVPGRLPDGLERLLRRPAPLPRVPALPVTLPSRVIAERPDIREAERRYAAANARIGAAVASLYPDFSLPLSLGLQSSMIHELLSADSLAFQFVLSAAQPITHGGRLSAQVREARAQAEAARLSYGRTVLTAFREVEDRLVAYRQDSERGALLHRAAADNALALDRARRLFGAGLIGFLDVLSAEQATYQSQNAAALGDLARLTDAVSLYTALGAGWQGAAVDAAPAHRR